MAVKITSTKSNLDERIGSDLRFPIVNAINPVAGLDLLIQDIQQVLLTIPGERVHRPEFGCGLRQHI